MGPYTRITPQVYPNMSTMMNRDNMTHSESHIELGAAPTRREARRRVGEQLALLQDLVLG